MDDLLMDANNTSSLPSVPTGPPTPYVSLAFCLCWCVPALLYWLLDSLTNTRKRIVLRGDACSSASATATSPRRRLAQDSMRAPLVTAGQHQVFRHKVLLASLEHALPHLPKASVTAGGLGKVVNLISKHHPTDIIMVHPMVRQDEKVDYSNPEMVPEERLRVTVDNVVHTVEVFRHTVIHEDTGVKVDILMLASPFLESRTKASIYPNPLSRRKVLQFFSLWNQCVGLLMVRHNVDIFHCPDFHTAVAPWYALPRRPNLRVLLVLHNAEYQGSVSTDMILGDKLKDMAKIWNLPVDVVRDHLILDGRLNMLKAAVDYVLVNQEGRGVCAVSDYYAQECMATYSIFWRLPAIDGLDNPMLEEERPKLPALEGASAAAAGGDLGAFGDKGQMERLLELKNSARKEIQQTYSLNVDPEARIFVFLGRLVRQKGVDLISDVAPAMLQQHEKAQLIIIGPVGDGFGHYAKKKLNDLAANPDYAGRLYVCCEFTRVPTVFKFAADFCLMPSRDEPFGYVDIEFAWHGALLVGAQAGGLGKVPGFYYLAQNRENLHRLHQEFLAAISQAMRTPTERLNEMALEAMRCSFPLAQWQEKLLELYGKLTDGLELEHNAVELVGTRTSRGDQGSNQDSGGRPKSNTVLDLPPLSMLDQAPQATEVVSAVRLVSVDLDTVWDCDNEILVQELSENELADRVCDALEEDSSRNIVEILERIGCDIYIAREKNPLSRWLLQRNVGTARIHWLIAAGYIGSPLGSFLTFVLSTEWGSRGSTDLPDWFRYVPLLSQYNSRTGIDATVLTMLLFMVAGSASVIGTPLLAALCIRMQPRRVLCLCMVVQLSIVPALFMKSPSINMAICLVFLQGLAGSSSLLLIAFNYMMSIKADISHAAMRFGYQEMLRNLVSWICTGYIFFVCPTSIGGTETDVLPTEVSLVLLPLAFGLLFFTVLPGVLFFFAPGPYRDDRFPGWDFGLLLQKPSFFLLSVSDIIGGLYLYPATCYIAWWIANGWTTHSLAMMSIVFGMIIGVGTFAWAYSLSLVSVHGFSLLIGVTLLMPPAPLLRGLVQEEVSTVTFFGSSEAAVGICVLSLVFEGMRASAMWTAKIRILNSRWRLLSYGTLFISLTNVVSLLSPLLCESLANTFAKSFITSNQKELADAVVICVVPFATLQFFVQALAMPFIRADMGIGIGANRDSMHRWQCGHRKRRSLLLISLAGAFFMFFVIWVNEAYLLSRPIQFISTFPCHGEHLENLRHCTLLEDRVNVKMAVRDGFGFGPNKYGQNTTARYNCKDRMNILGGDTFSFWGHGRCKVWLCGKSDNETESRLHEEPEVWSRMCTTSYQNLVAVHLFEWRWTDIADECETYLGPAGFSMVQVSPPTEHIQGASWSIRYQPVSYKLESRSGTTQEFIDMVRRCRKVGVNIMVDAVINHMASQYIQEPPEVRDKVCGSKENTTGHDGKPGKSTVPCMGWAGTEFGNREFLNGQKDLDYFTQEDFHHAPGNPTTNCGLPPWTNNRKTCDLVALPDLNTESVRVQRQLQNYLWELYEIGVTMLRIDASMNMAAQSIAMVLAPFPWEYVVQEFYPDVMRKEPTTQADAMAISPLTDFTYGQRLGKILFDSWDGNQWRDRTEHFGELLDLSEKPLPNCHYKMDCDSPLPGSRALLFVDNHDQQRERWKPPPEGGGPPAEGPICFWDGNDIGNCRPIYKLGLQYHLAQRFMLAWPYGDSVRIMSSFAWDEFNQGPPGVRPGTTHDETLHKTKCRETPLTTPVTEEYDNDTSTGYVCEHRWQGVAGLVRFRRLVGTKHIVASQKWYNPEEGHQAYTLVDHSNPGVTTPVAFVAMSRGWNIKTERGSNSTFDLVKESKDHYLTTMLPAGTYCNLAAVWTPLPGPEEYRRQGNHCPKGADHVMITKEQQFIMGEVPTGQMLVIHKDYLAVQDDDEVDLALAAQEELLAEQTFAGRLADGEDRGEGALSDALLDGRGSEELATEEPEGISGAPNVKALEAMGSPEAEQIMV
eukprot:TRINITY_DN16274_c0_g3_i1.p1 TRINITY_DN16274_c0_g3~~TRINITY_DN16274_c0_g3_i1.p1  ORF type:complete len:2002 (+),score=497.55 TRINITY_DN16274_c0_g3_i1:86-6091(+)